MPSKYFTLLTNIGSALHANAQIQQTKVPWTHMALGDGNGADVIPNQSQTGLVREVHRLPITAIDPHPTNPNWIVVEAVVPNNVGGWTVRETAIFGGANSAQCIAVGNYPASYKPVLAEGAVREMVMRMIVEISSTATVNLVIDPAVAIASRQFVEEFVGKELSKLDSKQSVRVATTGNVVLSGLQSIDGVVLAAGDRVLIKDQAAAKDNGIYVAAAGAWSRSADADTSERLTPELCVGVEQGTVNGDSLWMLTTDAPIVLGTTSLTFEVSGGRPLATKAWAQTYTASALGALGLGLGNDIRQSVLNGNNQPKDYFSKGERWGFVDGGSGGLLIPGLAANTYGCLRVSSQYSDESGVASVTREFTSAGRVFLSSAVNGAQWGAWCELANVAHVSDALGTAKQYADNVGAAATQAANIYTDGVGLSAKQYADNGASGALQSAKTYADGAAGGALQSAKSYADAAMPVGSIVLWPSSVPPASNYLRMNGAAISRTTYAKLFAVIGTTYGAGDGVNTFNVPDARGEFPRFLSDGSSVDSGRVIGSKQLDALQSHNHGLPTGVGNGLSSASRWGIPDNIWIDNGAAGSNANPDTNAFANTWETNAGGPNEVGRFNAIETRPRNIAFMGLIKFQ